MDQERNLSSTLLASGSTSTPILEPSSLRSHDYSPQGQSHPMHYLPNRTSGRQTRHAMHRESQHYPMAERCMCSSCHLSAKLFPRTEDGRIMLPIVPVTRSVSAHGHVPFGHAHAYAGQPGDLVQYMLVPNEFGDHLAQGREVGHSDVDVTRDAEMKALDPTSLIGPGVAGPPGQSRPHHHHPSLSQRLSPDRPASSHSTKRDYEQDYDYAMGPPPSRPLSGAYRGPPLPPHPSPVTISSSHSNMGPPHSGRGRPKGKGKSKTTASMDASSDGSGSTRNSPVPPIPIPGSSSSISNPPTSRHHPPPPPPPLHHTHHMSMTGVNGELVTARGQGQGQQQQQTQGQMQVELAPCKPRRGRPPRHEVVPGMGNGFAGMIDLSQSRGQRGDEKPGESKIEYAVKKGIRFRSPILGDPQVHSEDEDEETQQLRLRWSTRKQRQGFSRSEERCQFRFYDVETGEHY